MFAGLVETSNNVASVQPAAGPAAAGAAVTYTVVTSTRSSFGPALEAVRDNIEDIAHLCGATVSRGKAYPGWAPNPSSPLLKVRERACVVQ